MSPIGDACWYITVSASLHSFLKTEHQPNPPTAAVVAVGRVWLLPPNTSHQRQHDPRRETDEYHECYYQRHHLVHLRQRRRPAGLHVQRYPVLLCEERAGRRVQGREQQRSSSCQLHLRCVGQSADCNRRNGCYQPDSLPWVLL